MENQTALTPRGKMLEELQDARTPRGKEHHYAPKVMGWEEVKNLYLTNLPVKELSRLSGYSYQAIYQRATKEHWKLEKHTFGKQLREKTLERWGTDASEQAKELMSLQGRLAELAEREIAELEMTEASKDNQRKRSAMKERVGIISTLSNTLAQATSGLRLLIGQATERTEVASLSALIVELRKEGYGERHAATTHDSQKEGEL